MVAYNPRGAEDPGASGRDEGYLYWLGWFAHNGSSLWNNQDAHGPMRRLYTTGSCRNLLDLLQASPGGPVIGGIITGLRAAVRARGTCDR